MGRSKKDEGRLTTKGGQNVSKNIEPYNLPPLSREVVKLDTWTLPSMAAASACMSRRLLYYKERKPEMREALLQIGPNAVRGNAERLKLALAQSDNLLADTFVSDPRLARKSQWFRGEEGDIACPALLSEGDDAPCFQRRRAVEGQPNGADPIRIVISTDDSSILPGTAAAFIAAVRVVQQFRPVQVWWQGSWLNDKGLGWAFHVPLIDGDMDFARLEFCIADRCRDILSWAVMMVRACEDTHASWSGCSMQAKWSHLPGDYSHFVPHTGIEPTGDSIAYQAARWLGWDTMYDVRWAEDRGQSAALQTIPTPYVAPKARTKEELDRDRVESARYESERRQREATAAARRAAAIA